MPQVHNDKEKKQRNLERLKDPAKAIGANRAGPKSAGLEAQVAALNPNNQAGFEAQANGQKPGPQPYGPAMGLPKLPRIPGQQAQQAHQANALTPLPRMPFPMQQGQQPVVNAPSRPKGQAPEMPMVAPVGPSAPVLNESNEKKDLFGRSKAKTLASGTANEVTKVKYKSGIGEGDQKRGFWKQGTTSGAADVVGIDKKPGQAKMVPSKKDPSRLVNNTKIEKTDDPRLAARAVASSRLDKALGTDVIADEAFAERNGQMGNVSALVEGRSLMQNKVGADGKLVGQDLAQVDAKDPAYQKSMANLGLVDYLSGQVDRHGGNIYYDPKTGHAKGIDNDLAFGQFDHQSNTGLGFGQALDALPKQIDAETAKVIRHMTVNQFRASIEPRPGDPEALHPSEVKIAVERFQKLKLHIAELTKQGALVTSWNDQTYADACNDADGTYLGRHEKKVATPTHSETLTPVPKVNAGAKTKT